MKKLIFSFGALLFLAACNSTSEGELSLNNGQKWVVNAEMKPHLEQSERILNDDSTRKRGRLRKTGGRPESPERPINQELHHERQKP